MTATLFDAAERRSIADRFEAFHDANPEVYRLFAGLASQARVAGMNRYSADAILHVLRWKLNVETGGDSGFSLNDHFSSRYARKLIEDDPSFDGFFELRSMHSE